MPRKTRNVGWVPDRKLVRTHAADPLPRRGNQDVSRQVKLTAGIHAAIKSGGTHHPETGADDLTHRE